MYTAAEMGSESELCEEMWSDIYERASASTVRCGVSEGCVERCGVSKSCVKRCGVSESCVE